MDEAVPPGKDDRRLRYTIYTERDGVSEKEGRVFENQHQPWGSIRRVLSQFEAVSRAVKVCEFHV